MFQVAFVDLDDTLFSSLHKQAEGARLEPAALLRDGSVISYTSPAQRSLAGWFRACDMVIPVTARTAEAFQRVLTRFNGYAVVSHGATILSSEGTYDLHWADRVDAGLRRDLPLLYGLRDQLNREHGGEGALSVRIAGEPGRPAYLMAKDPGKNPAKVAAASERCVLPWVQANTGFTHHLNGNNLAVLPPSIGKRAAVAYLLERLTNLHGDLFVIGAGDSLTDVSFLSLCDVAVVPTQSQIWTALEACAGGASS